MQRPIFADPKTDFAFKRIFGSEEHKDVLVAFLNNMLDLDEPHRIVGVELLPPEQRPPVPELKLSIVDVKCTDAHGVTYVVELTDERRCELASLNAAELAALLARLDERRSWT